MQAIEAAADSRGVTYAAMMETAGRAIAERVRERLPAGGGRVLVLVGPGNNGGDGLVAARHLAQSGATVSAYLSRPRDDSVFRAAQAAGVVFHTDDLERVRWLAAGADVIVDALLGTGAALPVRGAIASILDHVRIGVSVPAPLPNGQPAPLIVPHALTPPLAPRRPHVVAVDVPSGLDADSGAVDPRTLPADETITFEAAKYGQVSLPGAEAVGELRIAPLNLPAPLPERDSVRRWLVTAEAVRPHLPARPIGANKGTFGKALIIGGSANYIGAAGLAAQAAYRAGAGLVSVAAPEGVVRALAGALPEVTWFPLPESSKNGDQKTIEDAAASLAYTEVPDYNAVVIGPGLGRALSAYGLVETLLSHAEGRFPPLILDADGLNMLATVGEWWPKLPKHSILTPHPGEMARLCGFKPENGRTPVQQVQADRIGLAAAKAAEWGCIVVLKGAYTVIAAPDGEVAVLPFATPALARAGTGDVLAGMIAGFVAQGVAPFRAAIMAGYVHGAAGVQAASRIGAAAVLASDVIAAIPDVLRALAGAKTGTSERRG
jgi:NAD(P)H-hydrate epimerase